MTRACTGYGSVAALLLAAGLVLPTPALAGSIWDELRPSVFGDRAIESGQNLTFTAPYRAEDQRAVPIAVEAAFHDGRKVKSVTFMVDENPSPVAAVFRFADNRDRVSLGVNIRLDVASPVRVIVEASDGALYMAEKFVKASGLGVCAAPPIGDPQVAARTMGEMKFSDLTGRDAAAAATRFRRQARLDIRHPQNTGLQMNQITLLYIPHRYIETIEVHQGEAKILDITSGMTLSENPRIEFDYQVNSEGLMRVRASDTSHAVWEREFPIAPNS